METRRLNHGKSQPRGVVLIASLLIMVLLLLMGMALVGLALTENKLATNTRNLNAAFYVAEAGVDSLFVDLRALLASTPNPAPSALPNGGSLAPGGARAPANPNYAFDFGGSPAATRVSYVRTTAPYSYLTTIDKGPYQGLNAFTTDYQISTRVVGPLNTQARVNQVIQYQEIPLFQFGVFYGRGVDLEIAPGPPMIFNGRVHANSNIYVVANSGLQFDSFLTTAGSLYRYLKRDGTPQHYNNPLVKDANGSYQSLNFDHESNVGFNGAWAESDWKAQALSTFGGKVLDVAMGVTEITPPIPDLFYNPSNPDVVAHQLIEKSVAGESAGLQAAKLYYQADLRIVDGVATLKNGTPANLSLCSGTAVTTKSFYDKREGKTVTVTDVDVSALRTCPFLPGGGTLLYVSDGGIDKAVRLVNGSEVTAGGLTVATDNPMYIQGDYNTINKQPSAVLVDAITILSNN
ncbi:MAG TPA: PilX N-terminal domain-containing pilus assembly protein, partial [Candidatus Methylomirabilis sp.]|nr:PilX N-terminal domain-containing pilus assembly protein [Candidatus Methylomirabilis sp.]